MIDGFNKELNAYKPLDDIILENAPELLENEEIQDALIQMK